MKLEDIVALAKAGYTADQIDGFVTYQETQVPPVQQVQTVPSVQQVQTVPSVQQVQTVPSVPPVQQVQTVPSVPPVQQVQTVPQVQPVQTVHQVQTVPPVQQVQLPAPVSTPGLTPAKNGYINQTVDMLTRGGSREIKSFDDVYNMMRELSNQIIASNVVASRQPEPEYNPSDELAKIINPYDDKEEKNGK